MSPTLDPRRPPFVAHGSRWPCHTCHLVPAVALGLLRRVAAGSRLPHVVHGTGLPYTRLRNVVYGRCRPRCEELIRLSLWLYRDRLPLDSDAAPPAAPFHEWILAENAATRFPDYDPHRSAELTRCFHPDSRRTDTFMA